MSTKDNLKIINRKRGALKSSITKLSAFLDSDEDKDILHCEIKLESLQKIKTSLEEIKNAYYEEVDDENLNVLENAVVELEDECEKLEVSLRKILTSRNNSTKDSVTLNNATGSVSKTETVNIRLPEITLPKFSGHYQDWQNFKLQFNNLIHENEKLSENQKLFYLKSTLSGAAAEIVTLDDTYSSLFKALCDRFDNKRFICNSHLNEILSLDIPNQESAKCLRTFVDTCQKHIRALKSIGLELNEFSETLLINILVKKLDKESKRQYELSLDTSDLPKWNSFIEFLEKRCLILENIQAVGANMKPKHSESQRKSHSFLAKNYSKNICIACKGTQPHPLFKCISFLKLEPLTRLNLIKNTHCTNCLSNRHLIHKCLSDRTCKHCSHSHNSLLHINHDAARHKGDSVNNSAAMISDKQIPKRKSKNNHI